MIKSTDACYARDRDDRGVLALPLSLAFPFFPLAYIRIPLIIVKQFSGRDNISFLLGLTLPFTWVHFQEIQLTSSFVRVSSMPPISFLFLFRNK